MHGSLGKPGPASPDGPSSSSTLGKHQQPVDLFDALDTVNSSEEKIFESGYQEGITAGTLQGNIEGWSAGLTQGGRIGLELGSYHGFCCKLLEKISSNQPEVSSLDSQKLRKSCEKIIKFVDDFPVSNVEGEDLLRLVSQIRSQFSTLKSQLKLSDSATDSGQKFSF